MMTTTETATMETTAKEIVRWHVIGWRESTFQAAPGEPVRAGSTCEKCGQSIRYVVTLKRAYEREMERIAWEREAPTREAARAAKAAREAARAESNRKALALFIDGLAAVVASPNCTQWETRPGAE